MKNTTIEEAIKFDRANPVQHGWKREWYECHCGHIVNVDSNPQNSFLGDALAACGHPVNQMQKLYRLPETHLECSNDLAALLNSLRTSQRAFFASKPGTSARLLALGESKRLERELDEFLKERSKTSVETYQPNLFNA